MVQRIELYHFSEKPLCLIKGKIMFAKSVQLFLKMKKIEKKLRTYISKAIDRLKNLRKFALRTICPYKSWSN
jgi:hypothetical protein